MLALRANRPVKMVYNREESFVGHIHRHPARIWAEHRATREGRLVAVRMRILVDGGAYASSSTAVISNACSFAVGPYAVDNVADRRPRRLHEQPAVRCDARLRRGADLLRGRGADGQARGRARHRPGRAPAPERARAGRHARDRPGRHRLAADPRGHPARGGDARAARAGGAAARRRSACPAARGTRPAARASGAGSGSPSASRTSATRRASTTTARRASCSPRTARPRCTARRPRSARA